MAKSKSEYQVKRVTEVVLLLKAAVGYSQALQYPHAFLQSLVAFHSTCPSAHVEATQGQALAPCPANPHGSVVVYLGPNTARFCEVIRTIAFVPGLNAWAASAG